MPNPMTKEDSIRVMSTQVNQTPSLPPSSSSLWFCIKQLNPDVLLLSSNRRRRVMMSVKIPLPLMPREPAINTRMQRATLDRALAVTVVSRRSRWLRSLGCNWLLVWSFSLFGEVGLWIWECGMVRVCCLCSALLYFWGYDRCGSMYLGTFF